MSPWLALTGAVPPLVVMSFVDRFDPKRRSRRRWSMRLAAFAGGLSGLWQLFLHEEPVLLDPGVPSPPATGPWTQALYAAFLTYAATEEFWKALILRFFWNRPVIDGRVAAIVCAVRIGLGFALVENIIDTLRFTSYTVHGFAVAYGWRTVLSVP